MKMIIKFVLLLIILGAAYFGLAKLNLVPSLGDFGKKAERKELTIDQSAVLLDNVSSLSQLFTSTYYAELPVQEIKKEDAYFGLSKKEAKLIVIAKGTCYAGTDLAKLLKEDIEIIDSVTCNIKLPKATVLDVVINPEDFSIYSETGYWSTLEVQKLKEKAKSKITDLAVKSGILKKSNDRSIQLFKDFAKSVGYKNVTVKLRE
jgi:hypothetical protein